MVVFGFGVGAWVKIRFVHGDTRTFSPNNTCAVRPCSCFHAPGCVATYSSTTDALFMLRKNDRYLCLGFPVLLFDKTGPSANAHRIAVTGTSVPVTGCACIVRAFHQTACLSAFGHMFSPLFCSACFALVPESPQAYVRGNRYRALHLPSRLPCRYCHVICGLFPFALEQRSGPAFRRVQDARRGTRYSRWFPTSVCRYHCCCCCCYRRRRRWVISPTSAETRSWR